MVKELTQAELELQDIRREFEGDISELWYAINRLHDELAALKEANSPRVIITAWYERVEIEYIPSTEKPVLLSGGYLDTEHPQILQLNRGLEIVTNEASTKKLLEVRVIGKPDNTDRDLITDLLDTPRFATHFPSIKVTIFHFKTGEELETFTL